MEPSPGHVLDNPAWAALTGPHAHLAIGHGMARHYPRDIVPFSAIAQATPQAYRDLALDLPLGAEARLHRLVEEPLPADWEKLGSAPLLQMIADEAPALVASPASITRLGEADLGAMLELMAATNPGRFGRRSPILGTYLGIREGDRLVAMAGERMRVAGYVELSAISTSPQARRRGYAACLTAELMRLAFERGEQPILHVPASNAGAIALYRRLGFRVRRTLVSLRCRPKRVAS
jgi:ribosomal protein S18 acetylase RimI-like enzyme